MLTEFADRISKVLWRCSVDDRACRDSSKHLGPASGISNKGIILGRVLFSMLLGDVPVDENRERMLVHTLR